MVCLVAPAVINGLQPADAGSQWSLAAHAAGGAFLQWAKLHDKHYLQHDNSVELLHRFKVL